MIGCLGEIVFEVSERQVQTLNNFKWNGSARYSTHNRHGQNALTEFTGIDPDTITFDMYLSKALGSEPMTEVGRLFAYERAGTAIQFVLGDKGYGKYRWNVVKHTVTGKTYDAKGNLTGVSVSVSMKEYLRS